MMSSAQVASSIAQHAKDLPEKAIYVKVGLLENPTKDNLTEAWKEWITEAGGPIRDSFCFQSF